MSAVNLISKLMSVEDYQSSRSNLFPSADSLEWFMRRNMSTLTEAGAIVAPTGRKMLVPYKFDRAVLSIGQQRQAKRV